MLWAGARWTLRRSTACGNPLWVQRTARGEWSVRVGFRQGRARSITVPAPEFVVTALGVALERSQHLNLAHRTVELLLLRALAQNHDGDVSSALTDLSDALTLAAPRQYVRVFL